MKKQFLLKNKKRIPSFGNRGFSLVEMLVYIAILSVMLVTIITILTSLASSQKNINASRAVENSAATSFERISRDIRATLDINYSESVFESDSGILALSFEAGSPVGEVRFYVEDGVLLVEEDGVLSGPLTHSGAEVVRLNFSLIEESVSEAVKIEMEIVSGEGQYEKREVFRNTIALR